jgi:exodeoxyribonuclease VII small subunit
VSRKTAKTVDFEASMAELEGIVERLEQGDLSLEESLRQFERGVALTRGCEVALKEAEQKVKVLGTRPGAEPGLEDFEPVAGDAED